MRWTAHGAKVRGDRRGLHLRDLLAFFFVLLGKTWREMQMGIRTDRDFLERAENYRLAQPRVRPGAEVRSGPVEPDCLDRFDCDCPICGPANEARQLRPTPAHSRPVARARSPSMGLTTAFATTWRSRSLLRIRPGDRDDHLLQHRRDGAVTRG